MHREEAIEILCHEKIKKLTIQNREDILLSWWGIDENDTSFYKLPSEIQKEILSNEDIPKDVADSKYNALIMEALKSEFIGNRNEYISSKISELLNEQTQIEGDAESLFSCPCCKYKTLSVRGEYYVCPVCQWEDDGNDENSLNRYSSPNHMTLADARLAFYNSIYKNGSKENYERKDIIEQYYK